MHIATKDAEESLDPSGNLSILIKRYVKYLKLRMVKKRSRKRRLEWRTVEKRGEQHEEEGRIRQDRSKQERTGEGQLLGTPEAFPHLCKYFYRFCPL